MEILEDSIERSDIFKILSLLSIIILIIYVYMNSINLTCDKCQVRFVSNTVVSKEAFKDFNQDFKINITDLYKSYIQDDCLVRWDSTNGNFVTTKKIL